MSTDPTEWEVAVAATVDSAWVPVPSILGVELVLDDEAFQRAVLGGAAAAVTTYKAAILAEYDRRESQVRGVLEQTAEAFEAMRRSALEAAESVERKRRPVYPTNPQGFARRGRR